MCVNLIENPNLSISETETPIYMSSQNLHWHILKINVCSINEIPNNKQTKEQIIE